MMERKLDVLKRVYVLLLFFLVAAVVLFYRVININVFEGEQWQSERDSLYLKQVPIEAERGNILSDDGSFLAASIQFFDIRVDLNSNAMTDESFNKNIDSLSLCLSRYVNSSKSPAMYKNYLMDKRKEGSRSVLIKRRATYKELERIKRFPLFREGRYRGGLVVEPRIERIKPFKHLASRTIGEFRSNAQMVGLEGYFDNTLKGKSGYRYCHKVSSSVWLPVNELSEITPTQGTDIKTTINVGIQDVAQSALLKALEYHDAEFGVAIVMEVSTGAIKAIANLRQTEGGGYAELYNDAVGTQIEPGSTIKLATMMALLEDNRIDLEEPVQVNYGKGVFCNRTVNDSEPHEFRETTARHAFEISSNVGMARLVWNKYKVHGDEQKFINRFRQFHLDKKTGIEIHGESQPYLKNALDRKENWSCTSLPWMSFGYETTMTPLQILAFYNAVANKGKYMKPFLVSELIKNRRTEKKINPIILDKQIASKSTIGHAQKLLTGVMLNGTGKTMKLPFSVAGKTGTSQLNYMNKNAERRMYQSSFAGYFPADNPQYSCIVIVSDPKKNGYYGSKVAGPVFREIAMKCMNKTPEKMNTTLTDGKRFPEYSVGYKDDMIAALDYMGERYSNWTDSDFAVLVSNSDSLTLQTRKIETEMVPNVVNMTLRDALYILENKGYELEIEGQGRVVAQVPSSGNESPDRRIKLTLK